MASKREAGVWWVPKWASDREHAGALSVEALAYQWSWPSLEVRVTGARRYLSGTREWTSADGVLENWFCPITFRPARLIREAGDREPGPYVWDVSAVESGGEVWTHGRSADARKVDEWGAALAAIRRRVARVSKVAGPLAKGDLLGALSRLASVLDVRSMLVKSSLGRGSVYEGRPWGEVEVEPEDPSGLLWRLESGASAFLVQSGFTAEGRLLGDVVARATP
jgi:hypothetical protein